MGELVSCEHCQALACFRQDRITEEDRAALRPMVGEAALDAFVAAEEQLVAQVVEASAFCVGFKPLGKISAFFLKLVDGKEGVEIQQRLACNNPVLRDPEQRKQAVERRNVFFSLMESGQKRVVRGRHKK